jgi:hypothetical protein
MEEDVQVQGDERFKKAKEYEVRGIKTTHLYGSKERKASIDVGDPERKPPFFDHCTEERAEGIPIIHQITGEDIVSDDCPLHQCKLIEGEDGKEEEDPYHPPIVFIKFFFRFKTLIH